MKIVNVEEMREIDRKTIKDCGIPGLILMENAGRAVAERVIEIVKSHPFPRVVIICGKGSNGGDGMVCARHLNRRRIDTKVFLLGRKRDAKGDARTNIDITSNFVPVVEISTATLNKIKSELESATLIVDAIIGTGVKGKLASPASNVIEMLSRQNKPVICIDVPSGLDADNGSLCDVCVRGTETVTMGFAKPGLFVNEGPDYSGRVTVADIGIPATLVKNVKSGISLLSEGEIASILPPRPQNAHKGMMGTVFVLAGSIGYTGAAVLSSEGAIRSGCGLVILGIPRTLNAVLETRLTEIITKPLPETDSVTLGLGVEEQIAEILEEADAVAIGPGIGRHSETSALVKKLMLTIEKPVVIDADGINGLGGDLQILSRRPAPTVITPHPGEMAHLTGKSVEAIKNNPIGISKEVASKCKTVVVLKDARTVIAAPDGQVFINPTGNPGMASAGCGDVLSGMIAGFIAQGLNILDAAKSGVFLHGLAGDIAAESKTQEAMIAGDLIESFPAAFKKIKQSLS